MRATRVLCHADAAYARLYAARACHRARYVIFLCRAVERLRARARTRARVDMPHIFTSMIH